jgi:hypothetical protein
VAFAVLKWFIGPVGRYVGIAVLCVAAFAWFKYDVARDAVQAYRADVLSREAKRVKQATDADDVARRCALDPSCRLRDDGFRRD